MFQRVAMVSLFLLGSLLPVGRVHSTDEKDGLLPANTPIQQAIDHYVDAAIKFEGFQAAPLADDATYLRRVTLDLVGRIPTPGELKEYLSSTHPDKKNNLVNRLMNSPGFVHHQAQELYTLMNGEGPQRRGRNNGSLRDYLRSALAQNKGWDKIFREVMLPESDKKDQKGAEEFLKSRVRDLNRLTIDVSTVFFGVNVSCAQCHDHPHVPSWTQDHFYGMKSFFSRTFENSGFLGEHEAGQVKYIPNKGKEKVAPVMFLTGKILNPPNVRELTNEDRQKERKLIEQAKKSKKSPPPPQYSLRAKLVETALAPDQDSYFARSAVNRAWDRFFGRGFVNPLDQMHVGNPPSHPKLLQWLGRDLKTHGYDLRRLIRGIVLSSAYARSSRWEGKEPPPEHLFAVARVRPLTPMQMAFSLKLATSDPKSMPKEPSALEKHLENLERAADGMANLFEQPGDRFEVSVSEAMLFANNADLQKQLLEGSNNLVSRLMQTPELDQRAALAVQTILSRAAQPAEIQTIRNYLNERSDRPESACRQVVWALLTNAEFRFNH